MEGSCNKEPAQTRGALHSLNGEPGESTSHDLATALIETQTNITPLKLRVEGLLGARVMDSKRITFT